MSVYTPVSRDALAAWLEPLGIGSLIDHAGIAAGMQNSNYFVTTSVGRYVLTLFEQIEPSALDFYLALQGHLAARRLPTPEPVLDPAGQRWRYLCGKPAALLTCLPGRAIDQPGRAECAAVGQVLARLHLAVQDFSPALANPCGVAWRQQVGQALLPVLPVTEANLLAEELASEAKEDWSALPQGVIHADLFRDNVLWSGPGELSGLLDFYFAGQDALLFDLAVVVNDWCHDSICFASLVDAYRAVRPFTAAELAAWPAIRRAAALRFWLLRLHARHRPRAGEVVTLKDPDEFRRRLEAIRLDPGSLTG